MSTPSSPGRRAAASSVLVLGALLAVVSGLLGLSSPAGAAGDPARIGHVERTSTGFSVLLDVPAGTTVSSSGVTATVNGTDYPATAQSAGTDKTVTRVAVLAIDTSDSMSRGGKFAAAKQAATAFVQGAPANVAVGIVTFDSRVNDALAPTTDHARALTTIAGLRLSRGTKLYDGVLDAARLAGDAGQRTVIVLSDGADTDSSASLSEATARLTAAGADGPIVDVVALDQSGTAVAAQLSALQSLAVRGQVVSTRDGALVETFAAAAAVLSRQIAVTITVPAAAAASQSTVAVRLSSSSGVLEAQATVPKAEAAATITPFVTPATSAASGRTIPSWVLYVGVGVFGVGLLLALLMLIPARQVPLTVEERVSSFTVAANGPAPGSGGVASPAAKSSEPALAQATQAVSQVLKRNAGLEERIARRLDGAGSGLKPAEWLLLHGGVFLLFALIGLLVGGGNILIGLLFMAAGAVGPWLYLGSRRRRRRKAFNAALPDTLTLMSGSLSAGLSLGQSVDTIVREGAEPVASEFRRVLIETRLGVGLEDAFDGVAERFDSIDFRWVVMAIRIQRQVGGNLAELLDTVAGTIREREYMRRQVAALAAEGKLSAYVLSGLPPLFLLYLLLTNRSYVSVLFTDPRGIAMLVGAAALLGLGSFWMSRLIKVEV